MEAALKAAQAEVATEAAAATASSLPSSSWCSDGRGAGAGREDSPSPTSEMPSEWRDDGRGSPPSMSYSSRRR